MGSSPGCYWLYVLGKPLTLFPLLLNGNDNGLTLLKCVNYSKWKVVIMSSTGRVQAGTEHIVLVIIVKLLSHARVFCDPVDCSPSASSVHGISQARVLEWVAISFSNQSTMPQLFIIYPSRFINCLLALSYLS